MRIRVDLHTLERAEERGTSQEEIEDVINTGTPIPAKYGRKGRAKVYGFNKEYSGKYYEQKRVEVFYTIKDGLIVTVTVYVFYGKWGKKDADSV